MLNAALGRESVASVPPEQAGLGSGANNTARYLGSALGVTVVSVVAVPSGPVTAAALVDGWNRAALVTAAVSLLGALVVLLVGSGRRSRSSPTRSVRKSGRPARSMLPRVGAMVTYMVMVRRGRGPAAAPDGVLGMASAPT